jgi:hypothetical protein
MASETSDLIKGIISRVKISAAWTFLATAWFGLEVGRIIWKPNDEFYPFTVLFWGAATILTLFGTRSVLMQLAFAVPLSEADATRTKARGILVTDLGIAGISFCFAVCMVATKRVGGFYIVAAVVFGVLLVLIGFLMHRAIKRLAEFVKPLGSV